MTICADKSEMCISDAENMTDSILTPNYRR